MKRQTTREILYFLAFAIALGIFFTYVYRDLLGLGNFAWCDVTPFYPASRNFQAFFNAWQPDSLGRALQDAPYHAFFGILSAVFGAEHAQQLFWFSLQPVSGLTMYLLLSKTGWIKSRAAIFIASFLYCINPIPSMAFAAGWLPVLELYPFSPLLILFFHNMLEGQYRWLNLFLFSAVLGFAVSLTDSAIFMLTPLLLGYLCIKSVISWRIDYLKRSALLIPVCLVLLFLVISPFILSYLFWSDEYTRAQALSSETLTRGATLATYELYDLSVTSRLLGGHIDWFGGFPGQSGFSGFFFPILAFAALLSRNREKLKLALTFSFIALGIITFVWLTHLGLLWGLFSRFPVLYMFRESGKALSLLPVVYMVLIAITLDNLFAMIARLREGTATKRTTMVQSALAILLLAIPLQYNSLLFSGDQGIALAQEGRYGRFEDIGDIMEVSKPAAYEEAARWIQERHNEEGYFRVLWMPVNREANKWYRQMDSFVVYPVDSLSFNPADAYINTCFQQLINDDGRYLAELLSTASVKYVLVNRTARWTGELRPSRDNLGIVGDPEKMVEILDNLEDFQLVYDEERLAIYENKRFLPHIAVCSSSSVVISPSFTPTGQKMQSQRLFDNLLASPGFEEEVQFTGLITGFNSLNEPVNMELTVIGQKTKSVSSENALANYSFEETTGWQITSSPENVTYDNNRAYSGQFSLRIEQKETEGWTGARQIIPIQPDQPYFISARVMTSVPQDFSHSSHLKVVWFNTENQKISTDYLHFPAEQDHDPEMWRNETPESKFVQSPPDAVKVIVNLLAGPAPDPSTPAVTWFDDIELCPVTVDTKPASLSLDTADFKEAPASIKIDGFVNQQGSLGVKIETGTPLDLKREEFLAFWFKCSHASSPVYKVLIEDADHNRQQMEFAYEEPTVWQQVVLPLLRGFKSRDPDFDLRRVSSITVEITGDPKTNYQMQIDRLGTANGWQITSSPENITYDNNRAYSGQSSLKIERKETEGWNSVLQTISVQPDQPYFISARVMTSVPQDFSQSSHLKVEWFNAQNQKISTDYLHFPTEPDRDPEMWRNETPESKLVLSPPGAIRAIVILLAGPAPDSSTPAVTWFDDIEFYHSSAFTPLPLATWLTEPYSIDGLNASDTLVGYAGFDDITEEDEKLIELSDTVYVIDDFDKLNDSINTNRDQTLVLTAEAEENFSINQGLWYVWHQEDTSGEYLLRSNGPGIISMEFTIPRSNDYTLSIQATAGETPEIEIDDEVIGITNTTIGGTVRLETGALPLKAGKHNLKISVNTSTGLDYLTISSPQSRDTSREQPAMNLLKTSLTHYRLEIESDEPVFIYLGDTYHSAWNACCNGKKLEHFRANWWANGFYLEGTGKNTVDIVFERQTTRYIMCGMWALGWLTILVGICHFSRRKIKEKMEGVSMDSPDGDIF
jgi:hypothetical protein